MDNDIILINQIIEEEGKKKGINYKDGKFFERFCVNQILKNYDLSEEDIEYGITDGKDDGGIDAIYCFANGQLLSESNLVDRFRGDISIELYIITSKLEDSFKQAVLNSEHSTISEFFDFSKDNDVLTCPYNDVVLEKRTIFLHFYKNNILKIKDLQIKYFYVSRGNVTMLADNIRAKADQIIGLTKQKVSECSCDYTFMGSRELLMEYRKKKVFDLSLPITNVIAADTQKFIVLCKIKDYFDFITDSNNNLKNYLFDSNVRDYCGLNKTNVDILETLSKNDGVDFWWLNNGITILSSKASSLGSEMKIENVQIVNGLQTSFSIYEHFRFNQNNDDNRKIMIKIISETDSAIRDRIIRSTNNQTSINEESLHATDKIQRDIEEILLRYGFYYERRKNYYLNQGVDPLLIVSPLSIATGYFSIIDRNIRKSMLLKQRFMLNEYLYEMVFKRPSLECWPRITKILLKSEQVINASKQTSKIKATTKNRILKSLMSFLVLSKYFGTFNYKEEDLSCLPLDVIDKLDYAETLDTLFEAEPIFEKAKWKKCETIDKIADYFSKKYGILEIDSFIKRKHKYLNENDQGEYGKKIYKKIKNAIPRQPWEKGMSKKIAHMFKLSIKSVSSAITYGINIGDFYQQVDGKLYDKDGNEIDLGNR